MSVKQSDDSLGVVLRPRRRDKKGVKSFVLSYVGDDQSNVDSHVLPVTRRARHDSIASDRATTGPNVKSFKRALETNQETIGSTEGCSTKKLYLDEVAQLPPSTSHQLPHIRNNSRGSTRRTTTKQESTETVTLLNAPISLPISTPKRDSSSRKSWYETPDSYEHRKSGDGIRPLSDELSTTSDLWSMGGERVIEFVFACRRASSSSGSCDIALQQHTSDTPLDGHSPTLSFSSPQEMEYLVKFQGESYRRLRWIPRQRLVQTKNDQADIKIVNFHRRMCGGNTSLEFPLTRQQEGNFKLYTIIDHILGVRRVNHDKSTFSSTSDAYVVIASPRNGINGNQTAWDADDFNEYTTAEKEYLVKWEHLGFACSTWELETRLTSEDDKRHIRIFEKFNTSFYFNDYTALLTSHVKVPEHKTDELLDGETYASTPSSSSYASCDLWKSFTARKLGSNGTYKPSLLNVMQTPSDVTHEGQKFSETLPCAKRLMAHQQEGIQWLCHNTQVHQHGSLLADEMGLGKTCQSIVFLEHYLDILSQQLSTGCHALVVVQKSVVENWRREFRTWTPHLYVYALCGKRKDREIARLYEEVWTCPFTGNTIFPAPENTVGRARKLIKPDVVLVTYEGLRSPEFSQLSKRLNATKALSGASDVFYWDCVIVDECQKLKGGQGSVLLQHISQLNRRVMVLLTGTPVQNTTKELFPMLTFLNPDRFYYTTKKKNRKANNDSWSVTKFEDYFSHLQDRADCMQRTEELHRLMAPYILRREKAHVLKTLPPKTVKLVRIPLTLIQKRMYSALYHKSLRTKGLKLSNIHMQLRKCCIHPFLIEGIEELIVSGRITGQLGKPLDINTVSCNEDKEVNCEAPNVPQVVDKEMQEQDKTEVMKSLFLESSGKFILLKKMIEFFYASKRKILLFSFFKSALDIIEDFISLYQYPFLVERVDGESSGEERQLAIDRFNTDENRFLFLCTTRAGGLGINLSSASVVIHLDSDFNPQHDMQAQARCHRIGQNKSVDVFHFIAEHTYENYMLFTIAGKKLGLEAVLLGRLDVTQSRMKLDKQQEEQILRKGVYAAVRDDDTTRREAAEFANLSIEEVLSKKSTTVTLHLKPVTKDSDEPSTHHVQSDSEPRTSTVITSSSTSVVPVFFPPTEDHTLGTPSLDDLDENDPAFWVQVAQRLRPLSFETENEAKSPELIRASRRRARFDFKRSSESQVPHCENEQNSSSRSFTPQDSHQLFRRPRSFHSQGQSSSKDHIGSASSSSSECVLEQSSSQESEYSSRRNSELDSEEDDAPPKKGSKSVHNRKRKGHKTMCKAVTQPSTAFSRLHGTENDPEKSSFHVTEAREETRGKQHEVPPCCDGEVGRPPDNFPTLPPIEPLQLPYKTNSVHDNALFSHQLSPESLGCTFQAPFNAFDILELLYCCLRALSFWQITPIGKTGNLKTEDIRYADHCLPWCLPFALQISRPITTSTDDLLYQSWFETLEEWRKALHDWGTLKTQTFTHYRQQALKTGSIPIPHEVYESSQVTSGPKDERFSWDTGVAAAPVFYQAVIKDLLCHCDHLAQQLLQEKPKWMMVKTQTWIPAEDCCLKLMFIDLMTKRYDSNPPTTPVTTMCWGQSHLEINWVLPTEALKRVNKYTGGPERRRNAVQERFYNKLDLRWNHQPFDCHERALLTIAVANKISPHVVAQQMFGRNLDFVRHGLKSPDILREAQAKQLLRSCSSLNTSELNNKHVQNVAFSAPVGGSFESQPFGYPSNISNGQVHQHDLLPYPYHTHRAIVSHLQGFSSTHSKILDAIKTFLVHFRIDYPTLENLINLLKNQPTTKLVGLLDRLQLLHDKHKEEKIQVSKSPTHSPCTATGPCTPTGHPCSSAGDASASTKSTWSSLTAAALELSASLQVVPIDSPVIERTRYDAEMVPNNVLNPIVKHLESGSRYSSSVTISQSYPAEVEYPVVKRT